MNDGLPEAESALRARILAIHQEDKQSGRCVHCIEWCDCMDVTQGDTYEELGEAWSNCTHGNRTWPCPTVQALDS